MSGTLKGNTSTFFVFTTFLFCNYAAWFALKFCLSAKKQFLRFLHNSIRFAYGHYLKLIIILQIGRSYYQQKKGISQGSVISTLLCNIYYGEMERRFPVEKGELKMRIVDDALFVTSSKERALAYCQQMISGESRIREVTENKLK